MVSLNEITIGHFAFTEVVENNLPYSATGWAQAWCPQYGGEHSYQVHLDNNGLSQYYTITACEDGPVGSHGGCSFCAMCKVTVELKPEYIDGVNPPPTPTPGGIDIKTIGIVLLAIGALAAAYLFSRNRERSAKK